MVYQLLSSVKPEPTERSCPSAPPSDGIALLLLAAQFIELTEISAKLYEQQQSPGQNKAATQGLKKEEASERKIIFFKLYLSLSFSSGIWR